MSRPPPSISVVIPSLAAAPGLARLLPVLAGSGLFAELVVADGGSSDGTADVARAAGARLVAAPRGRGTQLAAGAGAANGDWLLFLHADVRPGEGWREAVLDHVRDPRMAERAGWFRHAVDDAHPAARRVERLANWRSRRLALPYGDQGLLIARPLYDRIGGYRPLPLMEDVDIVRRLGRARLRALPAALHASAARYRRDGWWARPARNLFCLSLYFLGVPPRRIARIYG